MSKPLEILKSTWEHAAFREPQEAIIDAVLAKRDVIALLPTGGGKSLCFQIPTLLQDGICLVISPLLALMQDQVDGLNQKGIKAATIPSGTKQDTIVALFDNLQFGNYKFLYISPERLQSAFIQNKIKQLTVSLIAIDEAHCISEWGHDFRPSYRNINCLKKIQPSATFIALTATATSKVLQDIAENLNLKNAAVFKKSFSRSNLAYQLFNVEDKLGKLIQIFTKTKAPAIVYVKTRNKTIQIAKFLEANGFSAGFYHGGLSSEEKKQSFANWMDEKSLIMVATSAFGMGIDKSNVKLVVHVDLPSSIENYIQEAGRAGRNGKKAFSVVLYNAHDILVEKEQLYTQLPTISEIKEIYKKLHNYYQIAQGEVCETTVDFQIDAFSDLYKLNPLKLSNTLTLLGNHGIIQFLDSYNQQSTLQITASNKQIVSYSSLQNPTGTLIKTILRSYGGLFEQPTKINEYWLSKKSGLSIIKIDEILNKLHLDQVVDYKKLNNIAKLTFLAPREDNTAINRIAKDIRAYSAQKKKKTEELLEFLTNSAVCRSVQLLHYFNEPEVKACGICDVCLSKKNKTADIGKEILNLLQVKGALSSKEIHREMQYKESHILVNLQQLLAEDHIGINSQNQYYTK